MPCWCSAFACFHPIRWWSWHKMCPGTTQCAVHVGISPRAEEWKEAAAYPAKTPPGHSFECSPVKRGKIWDCVAPLSLHVSCQILKNVFCSVSQCGFWWIHLKEPFQDTLSGFYLPRVFFSHLRKYKMCFGIFVKALKQNLLRLAFFCKWMLVLFCIVTGIKM